jgi:hypothetical protein
LKKKHLSFRFSGSFPDTGRAYYNIFRKILPKKVYSFSKKRNKLIFSTTRTRSIINPFFIREKKSQKKDVNIDSDFNFGDAAYAPAASKDNQATLILEQNEHFM